MKIYTYYTSDEIGIYLKQYLEKQNLTYCGNILKHSFPNDGNISVCIKSCASEKIDFQTNLY